ncbi:MAG TPA: EpsG family protein, partial [Sphingomicrobium sp.]
ALERGPIALPEPRGSSLLVYWLLFAFFAAGALIAPVAARRLVAADGRSVGRERVPLRLGFLAGALATICLIGLRYKVGGDWSSYQLIFLQTRFVSLTHAIGMSDPAYGAINWLAYQVGGDIWLVDLVCGAIFGWGLYRFCNAQPSPWLAFAVAIPYLVIVVGMGYTRQSVALGILMAGLAKQVRGASTLNFALYTLGAALFHKTAIVMFPLVAIAGKGSKLVNISIALVTSLLLYVYFLNDAMDSLVHNYIDAEYQSQGALIRIVMNLIPAVLMWLFGRKLGFGEYEHKIWRNFSLAALLFFVMFWVIRSSTAVDRMSLYLLPLQIAVLTRVALLGANPLAGTVAVLAYLFAVEFTWLNFAQFSDHWIPYRFYPL